MLSAGFRASSVDISSPNYLFSIKIPGGILSFTDLRARDRVRVKGNLGVTFYSSRNTSINTTK